MSDLIGGIEARPARRLVLAAGIRPSALASASISHRRANQALDQVLTYLASPGDTSFVLLIGQSRVGKTHLIERIVVEVESMLADPTAPPAYRNTLVIGTPGAQGYRYPWYTYASEIITSLGAAPFELTTPPAWQSRPQREIERRRRLDVTGALAVAATMMRECQVQVLIQNEAVNLMPVLEGRLGPDHLHTLKDFVQRSGARLLGIGTEDLARLPGLSAEIGERTRVVRFEPYDFNDEDDRGEFARVANQLLELVAGDVPVLNEAQLDDLHASSAGRIGRLRNWLVDAESLMTTHRVSFLRALDDTRPPENPSLPSPTTRAYVPPRSLNGRPLNPGERRPAKPPLLMEEAPHG